MVSQMRQASFLALFFIVFCLAQTAFAVKSSRIELKDGKVYENVTFTVDDQYKIITIKMGDWKREVNFPDIARIYDENGKDITADYLGEYYKPPEESQKRDQQSTQKSLSRKHRKRPFDFGFSAGTNYSFPIGDYYHGIKSGIGFGVDVIIPVTKEVAIRGTISKSGMRDDLKELFPGVIIIEDNLSLSAWRYLVSGQYYRWPKWKTGGKLLYYGYVGLGAISHKFSGTALVQDPYSGDKYIIYGTKDTQSKFVITVGGGLITMISKTVGIEAGASLDEVFAGETSGYAYPYGYYGEGAIVFDLKVGLVAVF